MNKRALCLAVSILLGVSSLGSAGPMQEAAPSAGVETAAGAAAPMSAALDRLELGSLQSLGALSADESPEAAFLRAAVSRPELLNNAAIVAQAERALGPSELKRLMSSAAELRGRAQADGVIAQLLASWGEQSENLSSHRIAGILERVAGETAGWSKASESASSGVAGRFGHGQAALAKSTRLSKMRSAAAGAAFALSVVAAVPAHSQIIEPLKVMQDQGAAIQPQLPEQGPSKVAVADAQELLQSIEPGAQIYLIGQPRLKGSIVNKVLAAVKGKPYVVVIAAHPEADGNLYKDKAGKTITGFDAVLQAAQHELYAQSVVTQAKDSLTGERQGAVMTILLDKENGDRMFFQVSEQMGAHDVLGTDYYSRYALESGDMEGAVRTAIDQTEKRLAEAIEHETRLARSAIASAKSEVESLAALQADFAKRHPLASEGQIVTPLSEMKDALERAQSLFSAHKMKEALNASGGLPTRANRLILAMHSFDRAFDAVSGALVEARAAVDSLDKEAAAYRSQHAGATGDIANPDVAGMRRTLAEAETTLGTKPNDAASPIYSVRRQARDRAAALGDLPGGQARIASARTLLSELNGRSQPVDAASDLKSASALLAEAATLLDAGSSSWDLKLSSAERLLDRAGKSITEHSRLVRTLYGLGGLSLLAFGGLAAFLSGRRRRSR